MIRFIDSNIGIPFIKWVEGGLSGLIAGLSIVSASIIGHGRMAGNTAGLSVVTAKTIGYGLISGSINTFSKVYADINRVFYIEILRFKSIVTKFIKFK